MGRVFFRKNKINEAYRWEDDGAVRYKPINKKFKDDFIGTAEIDPATGQPKERHDRTSKSKMIGGVHFNDIEGFKRKRVSDWQYGLQSLDKLSFDMENLVDSWEIRAELIFQDMHAPFIYDYVKYVKQNMRIDFLDFNDWCKQNGINIEEEINMNRAYRKQNELRKRK